MSIDYGLERGLRLAFFCIALGLNWIHFRLFLRLYMRELRVDIGKMQR